MSVVLDVHGAEIGATGRLSRVGAAVGEGQTGRIVFADLDGVRGFRPGDFVTVRVEEPALQAVAELPATAVDAGGAVLLVGEDSRLAAVRVEILRRQGNTVLVCLPPELEGREIVAERSPLLGEGIRIRPVRPGQPMGEATAVTPGGRSGATEATAGEAGVARAAAMRSSDEDDGDLPDALGRITLTDARRAALIAFVEANSRMPREVRVRMIDELRAERVPADTVARLEARMGG